MSPALFERRALVPHRAGGRVASRLHGARPAAPQRDASELSNPPPPPKIR